MAITFIAWPTDDANSYSSVADADAYFVARLNATDWTGAVTATKQSALITATRMIDRQTWQGTPTVTDQPLAWPRSGVVDRYGNTMADDELPADFVLGFYELALALLQDDALQDTSTQGTNTKRVKAGQVEVEFFRSTLGLVGKFPNVVNDYLAQFLGGATGAEAGLAEGTDRCSFFDDDANSFELNDPQP